MANFRRKKPRTRTYGKGGSRGHWLSHWPAWWDRLFHTRPARHADHQLEKALVKGVVDPDEALPKFDGHKPHRYYW